MRLALEQQSANSAGTNGAGARVRDDRAVAARRAYYAAVGTALRVRRAAEGLRLARRVLAYAERARATSTDDLTLARDNTERAGVLLERARRADDLRRGELRVLLGLPSEGEVPLAAVRRFAAEPAEADPQAELARLAVEGKRWQEEDQRLREAPTSQAVVANMMPANAGVDLRPERTLVRSDAGARLYTERTLDEMFWLEIDRPGEPGTIGGYISPIDERRRGLVLILPGASTLETHALPGNALAYYENFGHELRVAGFMTWSVRVRECGSAYGDGDLRDVLALIDWLDDRGRGMLGVERVYVLGYSTGATLANLLACERRVTATVSLGGLTQPDQLELHADVYRQIADLAPGNIGYCQIGSTLDVYGPAGSPGWDALNVLDRIHELRNPMLLIHGTNDVFMFVRNTQNLEQRYRALRAAGADHLPPLEFLYLPGADHFAIATHPGTRARIVEYFLAFEKRARSSGNPSK